MKFYAPIDLIKNELQNAVVQNLGAAPSSPVKGQIYFDSTGNILYWYNGTGWIAAQGGAGAVPATTVTTQAVGDAPVVGVATTYAREDHKHGREAFGAITAETTFGAGSANGSATTVARSDHTHGNPAHNAAAHSGIFITDLAIPVTPLNLNGQRIINVGDPTSVGDAANKQYVDAVAQGLSWKDSCRAATTTNIALAGGPTAIDGVTLAANDRVLVKNQTTASQNGLYIYGGGGTYARSPDGAPGSALVGAATFIEEGTTQADTAWICTTNAPITIGSTNITFAQFGAGASYLAGAGLLLTGNVIDFQTGDTSLTVAADSVVVNTAVIATVASVNLKTDKTTTVTAGNGLTGGGDLSANRTLDVGAGTGIVVAADTVSIDPAVVVRKYTAAIAGNVAYATGEVITHNLNTRDVQVAVYNGASPYAAVQVEWEATTVNTVTLRYNPATLTGYRVVVMG